MWANNAHIAQFFKMLAWCLGSFQLRPVPITEGLKVFRIQMPSLRLWVYLALCESPSYLILCELINLRCSFLEN